MIDRSGRREAARSAARRPVRSGAVLVAVLLCLFVASLLAATLLRTLVARERQMRIEQHQLQALWLAESAAGRAAAELRESRNYNGETWRVPAAQLGGKDDGVVTIVVEPIDTAPNRRLIRIEALYPDDPVHRVRFVKQLVVTAPGGEQSP